MLNIQNLLLSFQNTSNFISRLIILSLAHFRVLYKSLILMIKKIYKINLIIHVLIHT